MLGIPEIKPVVGLNVNPVGNVVGLIAYEYVPKPPLPETGLVSLTCPVVNSMYEDCNTATNAGGGLSLITILNVPVFFCPVESVAVTLYVVLPNALVGVPLISPVVESNVKPVDSVGLIPYDSVP